jgi:DNA repair exonuclease SbcCD ATPase subunit
MDSSKRRRQNMKFQEEDIAQSYEESANIDTELDFFEQVNEWLSAENVYGDYSAYEDNYDTYEDELRKGKMKKMKKELQKHKKATKKLKREVKSLKAEMELTKESVDKNTQSISKIQSDVSFLKHANKKKLVSDNIHNIITEPDQRKRSKLIEDFADSIEEEF